jgi:hypothetical protein
MGDIRSFFTKADEKLIVSAVQEAEFRTSGEIRVRVEKKRGNDPMTAARKAFENLGMRNAKLHNPKGDINELPDAISYADEGGAR